MIPGSILDLCGCAFDMRRTHCKQISCAFNLFWSTDYESL